MLFLVGLRGLLSLSIWVETPCSQYLCTIPSKYFFFSCIGDINATRSEVEIYMKLSRQSLYHVTQSFFQSWLLGFLAYLTFWVDMEDFNDRWLKVDKWDNFQNGFLNSFLFWFSFIFQNMKPLRPMPVHFWHLIFYL